MSERLIFLEIAGEKANLEDPIRLMKCVHIHAGKFHYLFSFIESKV